MNSSNANPTRVLTERIERVIYQIRGEKVIFDHDLANLYGTTTKRLNEQVTRNSDRFPEDFSFHLSADEFNNLRSQFATANWSKKRYPPRVFTEHGAVMLATVLKTKVAIHASIQVVRTFVRLREILASHKALAHKLRELEEKYTEHDQKFQLVFEAIRQLMEPASTGNQKTIGFDIADKKQ